MKWGHHNLEVPRSVDALQGILTVIQCSFSHITWLSREDATWTVQETWQSLSLLNNQSQIRQLLFYKMHLLLIYMIILTKIINTCMSLIILHNMYESPFVEYLYFM